MLVAQLWRGNISDYFSPTGKWSRPLSTWCQRLQASASDASVTVADHLPTEDASEVNTEIQSPSE